MLTHLRNLLLLAALCWVAPASAGYEHGDEDCPSSSASRPMSVEGVAGSSRVLDSGARAFLP
jgi:hypothetical protein